MPFLSFLKHEIRVKGHLSCIFQRGTANRTHKMESHIAAIQQQLAECHSKLVREAKVIYCAGAAERVVLEQRYRGMLW